MKPDVSVIMVSYNTRELTLAALETLVANAGKVTLQVIVIDNASTDGSADAIAAKFPRFRLIRSESNLGFAEGNNIAARDASADHILLLNPDTETRDAAVERLLNFARQHPGAGITGGRTVYPDGSLNRASCLSKMTLWSLFCAAVGLTRLFPHSTLFNPEDMPEWDRDSVREVDVVVGCFLLLPRRLWLELGGFNPRYFMYGEDSDLCLRAAKLGYTPMITPDAEIMHLIGASSPTRADKLVKVLRGKATLIRDHWRGVPKVLGLALLWLWGATRRTAALVDPVPKRRELWRSVWSARTVWLAGY